MERLQKLSEGVEAWSYRTSSPAQTVSLGRRFGELLPAGCTVSLEGGLGAGKTCFVKGICAGAGCSGEVLSPTFILMEEYKGEFTVMHFDLYRLENLGEVYETGLFDAADGKNIVLVEWGDRLPEGVFEFDITVSIEIDGETGRKFRFEGPDNFIGLLRGGLDGE
jgi:tRNA threonylcarbamoyladenosine biosynthesis protein TsaE